jgi:ubiquinone/menaquinone biosynthesis C-methylase UbiE
MPLATEKEIQQAYRGEETAAKYVRDRFANPLFRVLHEKQVRAVQRVIDRERPQAVLEIAPGPGRVTRDVRPTGRLVCLEYNEGMIAEGRAACGGKAEFVQGNAFALPFNGAFDLVYTFRFIRHFHREDRERLYAEVRRVLRPGGYFVMDAVNVRVSKPLRDAHPDEFPVHDELYTPDRLRAELTAAGLEPVALEPVQKRYRLQHRSQVLIGPRANWLNNLVIRGLELLPARDGLEWVVTCRRA